MSTTAKLLRFQSSTTLHTGSALGPLIAGVVGFAVVFAITQNETGGGRSGPAAGVVQLLIWTVMGGQMGLFVAVARHTRTDPRQFLTLLPLPTQTVARCELLVDAILGNAVSLVALPILATIDAHVAVSLAAANLWCTLVSVVLSSQQRRMWSLFWAYLLGVMPGAGICAFLLAKAPLGAWVVTWVTLGLAALGWIGFFLKAPRSKSPAPLPQTQTQTQALGWRISFGFPVSTLIGQFTRGNPLFSIWLITAIGFAIISALSPQTTATQMWAWLLGIQLASSLAISFNRETSEFYLTRPITRTRYHATPILLGLLGTLLTPTAGWIALNARSDARMRAEVEEELGISAERPQSYVGIPVVPGRTIEDETALAKYEAHCRRVLENEFNVKNPDLVGIDLRGPFQKIDRRLVPPIGDRVVERCRAGGVASWSQAFWLALLWYFGIIGFMTRGSAVPKPDGKGSRRITGFGIVRLIVLLSILITLTAFAFNSSPYGPLPYWVHVLLLAGLVPYAWFRHVRYEMR